jgi:multidrug efflux pump
MEREDQDVTQQLMMESMGPLSKIAGVRVIRRRRRLPGAAIPVDLVIASAAEPKQLTDLANTLVQKAFASGMFIYADADLKFDQPQAEVVFDRDKLRSQESISARQAAICRRCLAPTMSTGSASRDAVTKSFRRWHAERMTPDQLQQMYITGSHDQLVPLSTFAHLKTSTEPRDLRKFQQLNAVRIQGVIPPPVPLDQALGFLEKEARAILPQGFAIDYAGESRQLRAEGGAFLGTFLLSAVLIYLVLAAQFESFPRSVHHPRRLRTAGRLRRAALLVPRLHDAEHLQPGRADHARRPRVEERDPDRAVRQSPS